MIRHTLAITLFLAPGAVLAETIITECPYLFPNNPTMRLHAAEMLHLGDAGTVDPGDENIKIAPKLRYTPHVYGDNGGFEGAVLQCRYGKWGKEVELRLPIPGYMFRYDTVIYDPGGVIPLLFIRAWATSVMKKAE